MAMMIENKIATTEHSNQLDRYYRSMLEAGPGWDTGWNVACVYLTPTETSLRTKRTFPSSYGAVCEILDGILDKPEPRRNIVRRETGCLASNVRR